MIRKNSMPSITKIVNNLYNIRQNFKNSFFELFSYSFLRNYNIITILLNLFNWALVTYIHNRVNQDQIVLHYNIDFGVNLYDNVNKIFFIPLIGLLIIAFNLFLTSRLIRKDKYISHVLQATALAANLLLFIATGSLALINLR